MINLARHINLARPPSLLTLHATFLSRSNEILKSDCFVRLPGKIDAATPDNIVASSINCFDHTVAINALYKYVFPVPPEPSIKNTVS